VERDGFRKIGDVIGALLDVLNQSQHRRAATHALRSGRIDHPTWCGGCRDHGTLGTGALHNCGAAGDHADTAAMSCQHPFDRADDGRCRGC
jgi:hypothetical protein